ncbi:pentapeptide repeat-containing protein [Pseudodonghicola xiamenensis]|uniref:Pentapeptide repeat-containing protein n=1 Tax=Pseudodonghicola xiamenensis TaxID=337702 RepID=A0A8J3H9Q3_9RHOB|nr:pentapeptide repeat-containing protein [Pseudodonghicola xiamenensis]GHG93145.1 hypothetical protein GCM10010961_25460 [Pseudodonghicola xiamenensis]
MSDQTTTLPIPPEVFWAIAGIGGLALLTLVIFGAMIPTGSGHVAPLERLKDRLGLASLNSGLFLIALAFWGALFLTLTVGLIWLIWDLIWMGIPEDTAKVWGFSIARIAGLTATLGAVVALPFTLIKVRMTGEQTRTAQEGLFNEKIKAASDDLHAMRQRWDGEAKQNIWEADIVRRNAAIHRLEGLVRERPEEAPRVSRLLSIYVREMSREVPAEEMPKAKPSTEKMKLWAESLTVKRSDMENAVRALGRLREINGVEQKSVVIDLRRANLQGFDFRLLNFNGADLSEAHLQGANLIMAQFQKADFYEAKMQGANLFLAHLQEANLTQAHLQEAFLNRAKLKKAEFRGTQLQGANLSEAHLHDAELNGMRLERAVLFKTQLQGGVLSGAMLQGAILMNAQLQGACLKGAEFNGATNLANTNFRGAAVTSIDFTNTPQITPHISEIFGDASVILPGGVTPDHPNWPLHFSKERLNDSAFHTAWRAFQASIGFDLDDPST